MKKITKIGAIVVIVAIALIYVLGTQRKVVYSDKIPDNKIYSAEGPEAITLYLYHQYGFEMFIDSKKITGEAAGVIIDHIQNLQETGKQEWQLSAEEIDLENLDGRTLPVDSGTMWIKTEDALYRIAADDSQISRVEKPLGRGSILEYPAEFKREVSELWSFWPKDCWNGVYENGILTMSHRYAGTSSVAVTVKSIRVSPLSNSIKLELVSDIDQTVKIRWETSNGSDVYGSKDSKDVTLKAGWARTIELPFEEVGWRAPYTYYLEIKVAQTELDILIETEE